MSKQGIIADMFCTECGVENKDTAVFCRKCGRRTDADDEAGAASGDEDETRLSAREREEATQLRRRRDRMPESASSFGYMPPSAAGAFVQAQIEKNLPPRPSRPDVLTDLQMADGSEREIFSIAPTLLFIKTGYILAAIAALLLVAIVSAYAASLVSTSLAVLLGLLIFLIPAYYHIGQRMVRYRLTETKLEVDRGLIARQTRNVPIRRIQDVTVASTVVQRILGIGDIVIDNASDEGGKVVLRHINSPRKYADLLLKQMARLER